MGCSQNCGSLLVIEYITAPNIQGLPKRDLSLGNYPYTDSKHLEQSENVVWCSILFGNEYNSEYTRVPKDFAVPSWGYPGKMTTCCCLGAGLYWNETSVWRDPSGILLEPCKRS